MAQQKEKPKYTIVKLQGETERLTGTIEDLKAKLETECAKKEAVENRCETKDADIDRLVNEIAKLKMDLQAEQTKVRDREQENKMELWKKDTEAEKSLRDAVSKKEKELHAEKQNALKLEVELQKWKEKYEEEKEKSKEEKEAKGRLDEKLQELKNKFHNEEIQRICKEQKIETLQAQLDKLEDRNKMNEVEIKSLQQQLQEAKRNGDLKEMETKHAKDTHEMQVELQVQKALQERHVGGLRQLEGVTPSHDGDRNLTQVKQPNK